MVSTYTAWLYIENSAFCYNFVYMGLVRFSIPITIISLNSNEMVHFVTETKCVPCEIEAGVLCFIQLNFGVQSMDAKEQVSWHSCLFKGVILNNLAIEQKFQRTDRQTDSSRILRTQTPGLFLNQGFLGSVLSLHFIYSGRFRGCTQSFRQIQWHLFQIKSRPLANAYFSVYHSHIFIALYPNIARVTINVLK